MTQNMPSPELMSSLPALPEIPKTVTLADGHEYNVTDDVCYLPEILGFATNVRFDWTLLTSVLVADGSRPVMSPRAVSLVKLYLLEKMGTVGKSLKPRSAKVIFNAMLDFARGLAALPEWLPVGRGFDWGDLSADIFDAWLTIEYRRKRKGNSAMRVRRFYRWGANHEANLPDFSPDLASILSVQHLKKSATGKLVESRDSRRGPFTREELDLIFEACQTGAGADHDRALAWTLLETVIRPMQMYLLTNQDLEGTKDTAEGGSCNDVLAETTYRLRVRKIKRQGNAIEYYFLPLSDGCARLLLDVRRPGGSPDERLFWWFSPSYAVSIQRGLASFSEDADIRSPRLPIENTEFGGPAYERLHITARRFRYGVASDRSALGESPEKIADMLGHQGTECVDIYTETSPRIADDFQRATDYAIAPLIDLMEGHARSSNASLLIDATPPATPDPRPYKDAPVFKRNGATYYAYQDQRQIYRAEVSITSSLWSDASEARVKELVARARRKLPLIYPDQDFDGQVWDIAHIRERSNTDGAIRFGFTTLASTSYRLSRRPEDALPPYFGDVIKSWIVVSNNVTPTFNVGRLSAARHFWNFLLARQSGHVPLFTWGQLCEEDILGFEQYLMAYRTRRNKPLRSNTISEIIKGIQSLIEFLISHRICRRIDYVPQTPSARQGATHSLNEKELAAQRKLPPAGALETFAGIYHRLTAAPEGEVSDWMLILISAAALLVLTGLRIGELVTLPFDCEVEDLLPEGRSRGPDSCRYGIRYWLEKSRETTMRIRWISPTAEPVVRASVARIKRLTAAARERARILEADPTRVTLPVEIARRTTLTRPEVLTLLGQKINSRVVTDPHGLLPEHGTRGEHYYYVKDLEAYLLSRRVPLLYTVRHEDDSVQKLSESLLIMFAKQSRCSQMDPCRLLVEPVKSRTIAWCFRPNGTFKTYGDAEWQRELSANPHCFRHWLIHTAYKGGMPTSLILRYFAKRYASSIVDYLHFSTDESDAYVPEELRAGSFYVPV